MVEYRREQTHNMQKATQHSISEQHRIIHLTADEKRVRDITEAAKCIKKERTRTGSEKSNILSRLEHFHSLWLCLHTRASQRIRNFYYTAQKNIYYRVLNAYANLAIQFNVFLQFPSSRLHSSLPSRAWDIIWYMHISWEKLSASRVYASLVLEAIKH